MRRSLARELEGAFLNLLTEAGWKDDRVIEPEFSVNLSFSFTPFGIPVEKKRALDALPVKEQIYTFLSVIGFEAQVDETLSSGGETLSEPALALKAQIQERVAAMTEQERVAFEETLLSSFPQEVIELDGVEYTFFVLELEVRVGDAVRIDATASAWRAGNGSSPAWKSPISRRLRRKAHRQRRPPLRKRRGLCRGRSLRQFIVSSHIRTRVVL